MSMYSSRVNQGFYDSEVTPELPSDAIELSYDDYMSLQISQRDGKVIDFTSVPPIAIDYVMPPDQIISSTLGRRDELLRIATIRIAPLQDSVDLGDATPSDDVMLRKWKQYRVALNRIELQEGYPANVVWPDTPTAF